MAYGIVYHWYCTKTNMGYVGQTVNTLSGRWKGHVRSAIRPKSKTGHWEFPKAIREHGIDNFVGRIICECESQEELNVAEKRWIHELDTLWPRGYNMRDGAQYTHETTRYLMSKAKLGKPLSAEHKQRISEALQGHPGWGPQTQTEESNQKRSQALKGKKHCEMTNETRKKISQAKKGTIPWNKGKKPGGKPRGPYGPRKKKNVQP